MINPTSTWTARDAFDADEAMALADLGWVADLVNLERDGPDLVVVYVVADAYVARVHLGEPATVAYTVFEPELEPDLAGRLSASLIGRAERLL